MVHVIYIHGTSIRRSRFDELFNRVQDALLGGSGRDDIHVWPCYYGDIGAELHDGKSIPDFDRTQNDEEKLEDDQTRYETALWNILLRTPLYELYMLSLHPSDSDVSYDCSPGSELWELFTKLSVPQEVIVPLHLTVGAITSARDTIASDDAVATMFQQIDGPMDDYRFALARAVIACATQQTVSDGAVSEEWLARSPNEYREQAVDAIVNLLNGPDGAPLDWLRRMGKGLVQIVGSVVVPLSLEVVTEQFFLKKRGAYSRPASGFFADIFKYQGNGAQIRDRVKETILSIPKKGEAKDIVEEPIVLLAHSLGSIICVDVLIQNLGAFPNIKHLITFGSQSPLFYEWDALVSLRYLQPIPEGFPRWTNIYDPRDPLAYVGKGVFQGTGPEDVQVNSYQIIADAHNGYYDLPEFWGGGIAETTQ